MRLPGIEAAGKTGKLPLPDSAVRILRRTPLAPLRKGNCRRSRLRGRFFRGALRMYLCVYCGSPVSKFPSKPENYRRTPLAPLRKGSCRRSRLRGRLFRGARTLLPIRLLRCPDRSLMAKPAQRATDGRPYELKSVPTKTVAIRTTGNCAILVQNFTPRPPWLPCVRGAVSAS